MTKLTATHKRHLADLLAAPARYQEFKPVIQGYMDQTPYRILASFEAALRVSDLLHELELKAETGQVTTLYSSVAPDAWNPYDVARALAPAGYFCNLTSIYHHALTIQVPSRIYVAVEENRAKDHHPAGTVALTDDEVFDAFVQPSRVSRRSVRFGKHEITITERVRRDGIGVETVHGTNRICPRGTRVTSLERALIDAVVLPQYNGGLSTVIETLRQGLPRVNQRRFLAIYTGLAYVYPYWQSIGFLCERLGAPRLASAIAKKFKPRNKFYLDHGAKTSWAFDEKWQLYYPAGAI